MHSDIASRPRSSGEVRYDTAAHTAAADDFGHLVHHTPDSSCCPGPPTTLRQRSGRPDRWVRRSPRRAAATRCAALAGPRRRRDRHVDLAEIRGVESDRVGVEAGATWSDVLAATLPAGLTPPVLPEYLELSVGGTLAVGGVGGTTSMLGMVSDTVTELEVVTGRGEALTCSPARNADLFDAVRAGLGQCGVITRATLRCVAAPGEVRRILLSYPTLAAMVRDSRMLAGDDRFDEVKGAILPAAAGGWTSNWMSPRASAAPHPTTASCWPACPTIPR